MNAPARSERGQVLPIMALLVIVFVGLLGLAIDVGRLWMAQTELGRAVDAAALAGIVDLPDVGGAQSKATTYLGDNLPGSAATFPATDQPYQIRVKGTRTVNMMFMGIFGFGNVDISAQATAGFGRIPADAVMAIDATGSMGASPCNSNDNNSGCPIWEAKNAAKAFTNTLLSNNTSGFTTVGLNPFRGCYNPPRTNSLCVAGSQLINLSTSATTINSQVDNVTAVGGTGTNVCLGLRKANEILFGTGHHTESNTRRFIVILTDGDNTYNNVSWGNGEPPTECRPTTTPSNSDGDVSSSCTSAQTRERQLDTKTQTLATSLKASGIEVYVVGFGVCGSSNTNLCNTGLIGGTSADTTADRNLLKCVASSAGSTNDHYFEVASASSLPSIFNQIAQAIAFRLVE